MSSHGQASSETAVKLEWLPSQLEVQEGLRRVTIFFRARHEAPSAARESVREGLRWVTIFAYPP